MQIFIFNPYFINIVMVLSIYIFLKYKNVPNKLINKIIIIVSAINWIIISGFRSLDIGADTINYRNMFYQTSLLRWDEILLGFINFFRKGIKVRDPGYHLITKFFQIFSMNYRGFLVFIAFITIIPLSIWIYHNSSDVLTSFMLFNVLYYSFLAITGIRQTLAMVLVIFVGFDFIKKRRFIPFTIITILAFYIHKSSLIFFPFYFIATFKPRRIYFYVAIILFVALMYFRNDYFELLSKISGYDNYDVYESSGPVIFTLFILGLIFLIIWKIDFENLEKDNYPLLNAIIVAVILLPISWVNPSAMRVVMYYSIFTMLLVPYIFNKFKHGEKFLVYVSFYAIIILNFISSIPNYSFFWQTIETITSI